MKRIVRSKSGSEIYGPKYRNSESWSENENPEAQPAGTNVVDSKSAIQASKGTIYISTGTSRQRICLSESHESMYKATLEGDYVGAEMLLEEHPALVIDEITEEGDRALHVAAAMKHQELVREFVERMNPSDLVLLDGTGYTACCYAAISGIVEIADLMIRKNPTLASARDRENRTPLYKAVLHRKGDMVLYLLKSTKVEDLSMEEWFDLLLMSIRGEMYGAALEICGIKEQLATMRNDEGTALHVLATQRFYTNRTLWITGVMHPDFRLLANKLWECIQRLGKTSVVERLKNPPILHIAAKMGNVELITMITQTYPSLIWHTDKEGYTIFHIAVIYRRGTLFDLIKEIGSNKDLIAASQDEEGNNILHLAAKLGLRGEEWSSTITSVRLREEMMWFEEVRLIVAWFCCGMKNKNGLTPAELFKKEHKNMLEKNATWTLNTADSWMLISTLILSMVIASAYAVPGGYDQETGIPILSKSKWFICFIIFEALAMFFSALSILQFTSVMIVAMESDSERQQGINTGLILLCLSVFCAITVFMSAYFMIYPLAMPLIIIVYIVLISILLSQSMVFPRKFSRSRLFAPRNRHSLFKRQPHGYKGRWVGRTTHSRCRIF